MHVSIPGVALREGGQGEASAGGPGAVSGGLQNGGDAHAERVQEVSLENAR